ncbi:glycosyltransferase family 4 protein [Planktothrix sp. FACHB-1355]|uniref:Glycosyltransferase family 4 protein n=1 Tax=Aerosakkonema funiforme FACHB-1375 TaxID=2949571 RepID=A0A926ZET3_9CYAN|nr:MULTISPECIES: glycosyltransferase family 4 protein [Oscillatoriales]MBD2179964.1 glycosyltransferase family 4 protein [Aerosakkonema funiforme FACHB-1375]MBD3561432.1 glycosyltransferase family 4 protein [Planktothrix sp. FACHB-1355]
MRIAVIGAKGLPAKQGGIEHHCEEIYTRMVKEGHEVDLFARSSYTGSNSVDTYNVGGVRVVSLPCLKAGGMDALLSSALGAMASLGKEYDIIHFHALGPSLFTWLPKFTTNAKIVVTCHGLDWQRAKWSRNIKKLIQFGERAAVRFADEIIVVSEDLRSYFKKTYDRETLYIPNAASCLGKSDPHFSFGTSLGLEQGRYILFLGRLVPEKCPDLLIQAFQKLRPQGWKLALVGATSDTPHFTAELDNLAAHDKDIVFTGELKGERLAEIIRGAGLFALPSQLEGLPLAMLEAMQEGIPVLASDIPVHKQLVSNNRGVLFPVGDLDCCVRRLDWAIHHPEEMAVMASNAQKYVQQNYNWDRITDETLGLYKSLLPIAVSPITTPEVTNILVKAEC